jgi:hypothetical protein
LLASFALNMLSPKNAADRDAVQAADQHTLALTLHAVRCGEECL